MNIEFPPDGFHKIAKWSTVGGLLVPWIFYTFPGGYAFFFSPFFISTSPAYSSTTLVDIWRYTFEYTQGTFTSSFLFWHIALLLSVTSVILAFLNYRLLASASQFLAAFSVLRLSLAIAENGRIKFFIPIGTVWMVATGIVLYATRE